VGELVDFYERYIEVFNRQAHEEFAAFFHLPVTVMHATRYDGRRAGRPLVSVSDPTAWSGPLPGHWDHSTIDSLVPLEDVAGFVPHAELVPDGPHREGLLATVSRWHRDGEPYEQMHVLYLLTREGGRLGIKVVVELSSARRADRP